jgi:hypothetical protein
MYGLKPVPFMSEARIFQVEIAALSSRVVVRSGGIALPSKPQPVFFKRRLRKGWMAIGILRFSWGGGCQRVDGDCGCQSPEAAPAVGWAMAAGQCDAVVADAEDVDEAGGAGYGGDWRAGCEESGEDVGPGGPSAGLSGVPVCGLHEAGYVDDEDIERVGLRADGSDLGSGWWG